MIKKTIIRSYLSFINTPNNNVTKYDLRDTTFLIPVRIESDERKANLETVIKIISRNFDTSIIVLEADQIQKIKPDKFRANFSYHFIYDIDPIYHKTKYVNQLLQLTNTTYAIVWDVDTIGIPKSIEKAITRLRFQECFLAFPYDGRHFCADKKISALFRRKLNYDVLTSNVSLMSLMYGYYSTGGAYAVNKDEFLKIGGENENFYGWGPEDTERVKRMEVLGLNVHYEEGEVIFHLWHPRKSNSWYANKETELRNRREFLRTCQSNKETLLLDIQKNK